MLPRPHSLGIRSRFTILIVRIGLHLNRVLLDFHAYRLIPYIILVGFLIIAVTSRILFNGMVYEFDYGVYQPDGIHYTIRTLMWLGNSDYSAADTVANWYAEHGTKVKFINPQEYVPQNNPGWPVIAPRVLYPLLSIPFVMFLGIPGMLVIPSLSLLVTMFAIYYYSKRSGAPWIGFVIAISVSISPTVLRWAVSNCTDGLLMAIFAIAMLLLLNTNESNWTLLKIAIVVGLACLTRFCLPIWILLSLISYKSSKKRSYAIFFSAVLFTAPTFMYKSDSGTIPASDNFSTLNDYAMFPVTFLKIFFIEIAQLAALDRILMMLILVAIFLSFITLSKLESQLFYAVFLGVFTLGAINGVLGVNFRYQLPLIPFSAVGIIAFLGQLKQKIKVRV